MKNKSVVIFGLLLVASVAFSQSDRGSITGTVSDPAGAVVPNAAIEGRNVETGVAYNGATSSTGNYTLVQLPAGTYEVSVAVPGFKKYTRAGLTVEVAQTLRIDIRLEVGAIGARSGAIAHRVCLSCAVEAPSASSLEHLGWLANYGPGSKLALIRIGIVPSALPV